jgi:hypothetical protein
MDGWVDGWKMGGFDTHALVDAPIALSRAAVQPGQRGGRSWECQAG